MAVAYKERPSDTPFVETIWHTLTESIGSSFRMSYEVAHAAPTPNAGKRSDVPAAVGHSPWDAPLPRGWAMRKVNLQHFTDFERGGHFATWEEPAMFAADVQDFVRQIR